MYLLAALWLGFLGSFHCVGMCGPIALAIPVNRTSFVTVLYGSLIYNFGRMITYAIAGLLFGMLGQVFRFAGLQNCLSILIGLLILAFIVVPIRFYNRFYNRFGSRCIVQFFSGLKQKLGRLFGVYTNRSLLVIGLLNGLLPCGFVYLGLSGALATGDALKGSLFMAAFGFGTFPAMVSVSILMSSITLRTREQIRKVIPVFVGLMAVLLILRGMSLGIPYISPGGEKTEHACCHK